MVYVWTMRSQLPMPTPFTHLAIAQRLLQDPALSSDVREALAKARDAFLLGNIAADARVGSGAARADTHFYQYGEPIDAPPWRVMTGRFPRLMQPHDAAHRAFVAGYVAHLSVDEYWTRNLSGPYFALKEWADRQERFYMLHILLITMDERDLASLEGWQAGALAAAEPLDWLPFASDADLRQWRDLIHTQIAPGGHSETLHIFGQRINKSAAEMRAIVDDPAQVQARLWDYVPRADVARIEAEMFAYARAQMAVYWQETLISTPRCHK